MRLDRLQLRGLRSISDVTLHFGPELNVLTGANGAGKTSILEAAFLLSHGRSFRSGAKDALLQRGASSFSVFGEWHQNSDNTRMVRLGLGRTGNRWDARIDGEKGSIGQLVGECAVVCFEPGSHALIAGGAEERRRYLDWGVFHVEQSFLPIWRRYQRALKQRNSLLRAETTPDDLFLPWEAELGRSAESIDLLRRSYLKNLLPHLKQHASLLLPELGSMELRYRAGWPEESDLATSLASHRARDVSRGHTSLGCHRADWSVHFEHAPIREHLSRGQEKLVALSCYMAQAHLYAEIKGEWPLICLDDLASELDETHQEAVVAALTCSSTQVLITGTELPSSLKQRPLSLFHVEQGSVRPLL